ncbi:MAG TPA: DUF4349 domain-containing protein [Solirubrobacterales bacterium]|nr:DUF4349 domain-containing protein [Solirubrobacterales bacterium]
MEPSKEEQLIEELRALRPSPHPEFAAELDKRAAAGFPRRSLLPRLSFSLPRRPSRRLLLPAGGLAVIAIGIAGVLVATSESEREPTGTEALGFLNGYSASEAAPEEVEESAVEPSPEIEKYQRATEGTAASDAVAPLYFDGSGRYVKGNTQLRKRAVERSARIVLGADPADVGEASAKVLEVVHAFDGVVMRSSAHQGPVGEAGAHFELRLPSARLGDALAALSEIGELRSRYENSLDITAPTVNVGELLQDSKARIDSLLGQLEGTETEAEREAVEAELRQERRHRARLRADLQRLRRHAEFSRVTVRIDTEAAEDSSGSAWGVPQALDDAGKVLAVAAAVAVVALAILGPIALIALLAWLAHRAWVRRERRRVLS